MNAQDKLKNRIKKILINALELNLKESEIKDGNNLDELFGLDSLAVIEFVLALEKEFEVKIETASLDINIIKDLNRLSVYIDKLIVRKDTNE